MRDIPTATNKRTTYENFVAECPWCCKESIFNRTSDLLTVQPIDGRDVSCLSPDCGKRFRIVGDLVNNAHEMLIFDCYELLNRKQYMQCVLSLAQAYEVFFGLFFRVELLYKPLGGNTDRNLSYVNQLSKALAEKLKRFTFEPMRALLLQYLVNGRSAKNLDAAAAEITAIPDSPETPKDEALDSLADRKLVALVKALKATNINTLRNQVVHKIAYRPTREEANEALKETRSILFPLTAKLQLSDDVNSFLRRV